MYVNVIPLATLAVEGEKQGYVSCDLFKEYAYVYASLNVSVKTVDDVGLVDMADLRQLLVLC
jgi:hypothetical protein